MSGLSPEARALFQAARRAADTPADAPARVLAGLQAQLALRAASATGAGAWLGKAAAMKYLAVAALALGAAWGGATVASRPARPPPREAVAARVAPAAPTTVAPAPAASVAESRRPDPVAEPPPAPIPPAARAAARIVPRAAPPVSPPVPVAPPAVALAPAPLDYGSSAPAPSLAPVRAGSAGGGPAGVGAAPAMQLADEVRLVSSAREALRGGDGARALATLDEHRRRFPDGGMASEASAVRVLALCDLGRRAEARSLARSWLAASPRSPLAASVRSSCAGDGD